MIKAHFRLAYPGFALDAALDLPGRGVTVLFGHSGSGKTTLLRAIAGLDRHPGGYLEVNGAVWQDDARRLFVPPCSREIGYVFQEASLFPHLTVQGNLDYARKRASPGHIDMAGVLDLLGIAPLLARPSTTLSGGERQRVAIARALLSGPRLMLFDEPLASLDRRRKDEVLPYLEKIHAQLDIPMLYVSHAADEVARLADHIVMLDEGKVTASGPASELLARLDLSMALTDDAGVVIRGRVDEVDARYGLLRLDVEGQKVHVVHTAVPLGSMLRLRILARDVSLALDAQSGSSILNQLQARVLDLWPAADPAHVIVSIDCGGTGLLARITRLSRDRLAIKPGMALYAQVKAVALLPV